MSLKPALLFQGRTANVLCEGGKGGDEINK